jgi:DNA-binding NtrC family response regulator
VYASADILIFGHDATLLETRRLVLKTAGFQVWTALKATDAVQILSAQPIGLFVLCRTLSNQECEGVLEAAHTLRPEMKNLVLGLEDRRDMFLTTFLGPKSLIALIQHEVDAESVTLPKH